MSSNELCALHMIHRRIGHVAVAYQENMLVWGGYVMGELLPSDDELFIYNTFTELWGRRLLKGDNPPGPSGSSAVILGDNMYVFGGYTDAGLLLDGYLNDLYRLDLQTMSWTHLHPEGMAPVRCDKMVGWMHNDKLYFFGGFGEVPTRPVSFSWVLEPSAGRAWNNQLVSYNPATNRWEWPTTRGITPSPRAAHATDKSDSRVFISGGRLESVRKNDLYVLDMDTMTWSEDLNSRNTGPSPIGRSWHSFTCITPNRAFLYGGFSTSNTTLNDCWFVDIEKEEMEDSVVRWKVQYSEPPHTQRFSVHRFWHQTTFIPRTGDLLCCGGQNKMFSRSYEESASDTDDAKDFLVVHFQPLSLLRLSFRAVLKNRTRTEHLWKNLPHFLQTILQKKTSDVCALGI